MENNMEAPERIWAWTYNDPWGNELRWFSSSDGFVPEGNEVEYIRADLAAPSAPAEGEGLDYAAIDAIRLEAFRTNDPDTKQRFLNAAGRWFQYEDCRAMNRAERLTALQAEIERLTAERDEALAQRDTWMERAMGELGDNLAARAKLKGDV